MAHKLDIGAAIPEYFRIRCIRNYQTNSEGGTCAWVPEDGGGERSAGTDPSAAVGMTKRFVAAAQDDTTRSPCSREV